MRRLAFLLLAALTSVSTAAEHARPRVFVSVLPQKHFVEKIAGDRVEVEVLVSPGQSPATYEPTSRQMSRLAASQLFFSIGVPFERGWLDRIAALDPGPRVVDAGAGIEKIGGGEGHRGHGHGPADPHIWTDPLRVRRMAETMRDALCETDPEGADRYKAGCAAFQAELDSLHAAIVARLGGLSRPRFLVFHASWAYFAQRYGLEQIAIEEEGRQPGARSLARIIDQARELEIDVIFVQKQFSRASAEAVADAVGARVLAVDPLAENYAENLLAVADAFAEAMR